MALFETLVEPLDSGSGITEAMGDSSVVGNQIIMPVTGTAYIAAAVNGNYEIDESWVSVHIAKTGVKVDEGPDWVTSSMFLYNFTTSHAFVLSVYANEAENALWCSLDSTPFTVPMDDQLFIAFSEADDVLTAHTSPDGAVWTARATVPNTWPGESFRLMFTASGNVGNVGSQTVEFDQINAFSPFGSPEPEGLSATRAGGFFAFM